MQQISATCRLCASDLSPISEPYQSIVNLYLQDTPNHTFWFGSVEVAADPDDYIKWIDDQARPPYWFDVELADGRRGVGQLLGSKVSGDIVTITFFGYTPLKKL